MRKLPNEQQMSNEQYAICKEKATHKEKANNNNDDPHAEKYCCLTMYLL
jgi:hypothetical protein